MRRQRVWFFTPWGTPYDGLYREAPPERGAFFRLQVYEKVAFHQVRYIKGKRNLSFPLVKIPIRVDRCIFWQ